MNKIKYAMNVLLFYIIGAIGKINFLLIHFLVARAKKINEIYEKIAKKIPSKFKENYDKKL